MAGVEAAINLVVRGSGAVNRLIQDVSRLDGLVESLSRSPIDISFTNADRQIGRFGAAVRTADGEIQGLQNSLNPLRQSYERTAQGAARFERANNVFNRSLEVSRRAVSLYQANIESLNRTAYGQPQRSAAISTLNTAFREGLVTQRDYARLMLRTRQEFANLYAAEAALERAQTRQNSLTREAAQNASSLLRARSAMAAQAQEIARGEQRIEMVRGRMAAQQDLLEGAEGFRNQIDFLNRLASSYTSVEAAAVRASGKLENIPKDMSRGGVRQEIGVFDDLANSVNYTSNAFNRFTIASQAANLTLGQIQRQRLRVLTEAFSPSFAAGTQPLDSPHRGEGAVDISNTRAAVNRLLLASQPSERADAPVQMGLVRSEAGLTLMIDQLQQLRALIPFVDADYGRLTQRITELNEELARGSGRPDPAQRRINAELSRQADIENRINEANLTIGQQEAVRNRLAEARVALEERGVEAAQEQTSGLTRQINAMQSINRAQERRNSAVEDELSLLEGRIGRIQRSDLPDDIKTVLTSRGNQAIDLLVGGPGVDPDLEGARRVRKELERDRIAAEKDYRSTLSVSEARSNQIGKILKLEQELNKIRLSGRDTAAQDVELGRIKDALTSNTVQLNKQLISDSSIALDRVADYVTQQRDGIRVTNEQIKNTEKQNKANQDLITKSNTLKIIQSQYNELKAKGISFGKEELELQSLISQVDSGQYDANEKNIRTLDTLIKKYTSFAALKQQDLRDMERWQQEGGPALPAVNRVVGPTSAINEPERIQDLLQRARIQQQALLGLQIKGRDVTQEQSEIQQLINELEGRSTNLKGKGANLSQKLREDVERELNIGDDRIRLMNGQMNIMGQVLSLEDSFIEKRNRLNSLLLKYNELKKQGVQFQGADVELETLVNSISGALSTTLTKDFVDDLGRRVKAFQSTQSRSVQEAVAAGTFTGTTQTPEKLEKERNRQLREAYGLRKTLDDLEKKGIASDLTRVDLLQQINTLEQRRGQIAADNLIAVQAELETTGRVLDVTRTEIARLKSDIEETSKATGFGKSFQDFQEALKGSRTFFGIENPAEAIDKIVREFNKDVQRAAVADAAPVQTAIRTEYEQMLDSFRNQFANLTTNPRFFGRLLSQIPDDALTTSMAGAATDMATRGRTTTGVLTGIGKIPGGLESQIESAYQDAFGRVPGGVTRLFDKIASVFDALVGRRFSGAGLGGSGGGVRPPSGPGGGAGGAGGPGNFGDRLTDAEAKGVGALLGLQELQKPSEVATVRLEILSNVLKDVYSQLDPTSEDAKRFNSALRRTTARLDEIVASRAPDADPLVRLTRSPRLAQGISEGLIGGAFPLLFGQGAGAAVGGGLGGFAGGFMGGALGFGLSLIGTAVGTAVDTFVNNMKELGKSLRDPAAALTAMETAGLRVTPQLQDTVERLQGLGLAAAAQDVVFSELEAQLGKDGAAQIRALTAEQKKLDEAMQDMNATIMSMLLPSVTGAVSIINDLAAAIKFLAEVEPPGWVKNLGGAAFNVASVVNPGFALSRFQFEEARKRGRQSAEEASQTPIGLTPEQQRQQELALPRATLEALNVQLDNGAKQFTDQVKAAAREQQDLDLQRRDLIESYERSIGDLRLTIERQVTQERLANAGRENEILAAQGEVRLQQLRNANAELTRSLSGNEFGQQLADAVSQFTEQQLSTENEIANRRRNLELELETKRIQTEQYRADIAKQVEQLNLSTAKQVASIQLSVARKNEDYDRKRFQLEKQIAAMNLNVSRIETEQKIAGLDLQVEAITDPALRQSFFNTINKYRDIISQGDSQIQKINAAQPPAPVSFNIPALVASVSTAGIDQVVAKGAQLARQLESIRTELNDIVSEGDFNELNNRLKNLADQGVQALTSEYEDLLAAMSADPTAAADKRIVDAMKAVTEGRGIQESPQREKLTALIQLYGNLAKQNIELARTYEFLTSRLSSQLDQIEELKEQFNTLTVGNTEYEKTLIALTQRGIDPASEGFSRLVQNAQEIDRLNQKIQVIDGFRTAATELTGSMRSLIEQFAELGSASEAVKTVSDELGKKSLGFVLDLAFKPVEDAMQKTMLDMATVLGFDITPESQKQLQEIATIRASVQSIEKQIASMFTGTVKLVDLPGGRQGIAFGDYGVNLDDSNTNSFSAQAFKTLFDHMKNTGAVNQFNEVSSYAQLYNIFKQKNPNFSFSNTVQPVITPKTNVPVSQQVDAPVPGSFRPVSDPKDYGRQYVEYQRQMLEYRRQLQNYNSPGMTIKYPPLSPGSNKYGIDYSLPHEKTNRGADSWPLQNRTIRGPQGGSYDQMPLIVPINGIGGPDLPGNSLLSQIQSEGGFEDIADLRALPVQRMLQQVGRPFTQLYRKIESDAKAGFANTRQEVKKMLAPNPVRTQQVLQRAQRVEEVKKNWDPLEAQWRERMNRMNPAPRSAPANASPETYEAITRRLAANASTRANNAGGGWTREYSDFLTPGELEVLRKGIQDQLRGGADPFNVEAGASMDIRRAVQKILQEQNIPKSRWSPPGSRPMFLRPSTGPLDDKRDPWVERYMRQTDPPRIIPGVESQFEGSFLPGQGFDVSKLEKSFGLTASMMNGIGGPDLGTRRPYSLPENQWADSPGLSPSPSVSPREQVDETGIPLPNSPALIRAQEELKRTTEAIEKVGNSTAQAIPQFQGWDLVTKDFMGSVDETTVHFEDATQRMNTVVPQWGKSLGQVVTGIGMASTAIIGIVGGIQNIRKGGAGNIFSGIGSILTTVGGLGMSIARFANGGVFEGDILDSPKLFNFEDAGVTKSGQAGEAGTEAIMPLSRTKDGRLGVSAELSIPFEMTDLITEDNPEGADPEFTGASASSTGGRGAAGAAGVLSVPFSRMGRRGSGMTAAQAMRAAAELGLSIPFVSNGDTAQAETTAGGADEVIRFESTVINGQEFVTREEAEKIGRVAAVKGADLARRRVRNNPQERRLQGIQ